MDGYIGLVGVVGFEKTACGTFCREILNRGAHRIVGQKVFYPYVRKYKDRLVTHINTHAVLKLPDIVADVGTYHTGMIHQSRDAAVVLGTLLMSVQNRPLERKGAAFSHEHELSLELLKIIALRIYHCT